MQWQNEKQKEKNALYCLQHRYYFCVLNFSEIISLEIKNFRARLGKKSGLGQKQCFLWGNYELHVLYRKFAGGEEKTEKKIFRRSFSAFFETFPFTVGENRAAEKLTLTGDAKYNTGITPLFLTFFPLLAKLGYPPFKVNVDVLCDIYPIFPGQQSASGETGGNQPDLYRKKERGQNAEAKEAWEKGTVREAGEKAAGKERAAAGIERKTAGGEERAREKKFLQAAGNDSLYLEKMLRMTGEGLPGEAFRQKQEAVKKRMPAASSLTNVSYEEKAAPAAVMPENNKNEAERDLPARERKKGIKAKKPVFDHQYDQAHRSFYERFFPEIPVKGKFPEKKNKK